MRLDYDATSHALHFVMHDASGATTLDLTAPLPSSMDMTAWHTIAVTFNSAVASLYVDGNGVGSANGGSANPVSYPDYAFVFLGNRFGEQSFFTGVMDEVRIVNANGDPAGY